MNDFPELLQRFDEAMREIGVDMTERAVTEMTIAIQGHATAITPIADSTLINSQFRRVTPTFNGYVGEVGYGASYALYVHEAPGTLLGTDTPRSDPTQGNVWDPDAEPEFLRKGARQAFEEDAETIIKGAYR